MLSRKYTEDVAKCERIGGYIRDRIYQLFESKKEVGERFAELTGLRPIYAISLVRGYCRGGFVHGFSSDSIFKAGAKPETCAMRLATLFTILGVEESYPIVALAREVNPRFAYPLPSDGYTPRTAEQVLGLEDVELDVRLKNGRQLKPGQLDNLRRLAALYGSSK